MSTNELRYVTVDKNVEERHLQKWSEPTVRIDVKVRLVWVTRGGSCTL